MNKMLKIAAMLILSIIIMPAAMAQGSETEMKTLKTALEQANGKATQFFGDLFQADTLTVDQIVDSISAQLAGPIRGAARATFTEFENHAKSQASKSPEKTKPFTVKVPKVKGELANLLRTTIEKEFPAAVATAKQNFIQCRRRNGDADICKEEVIAGMSTAILNNVRTALKAWFEKKIARL